MNMELIKWDEIAYQIATNTDVQQLSAMRNKLTAYKELAKQTKQSLETQNKIAEYRLRVDRKLGEWSKGLEAIPGKRTDLTCGNVQQVLSKRDYYKEIDISDKEMSRKEAMASVPEEDFEKHIATTKADKKELTSASVYRLVKKIEPIKLAIPTGKYRVFYADPPWTYTSGDQHATEEQSTVLGTHYRSLSIADLCNLDIKSMAEDNAVLFLWVTSPLLEEAFEVIKAWSFKYKASMVWDKVKHNVGHYVSVRHEFILICTRGSCKPDIPKLYDSVLTLERTEHSRKPEEIRAIIDEIYPSGKRIELFARGKFRGWDTWGNEA